MSASARRRTAARRTGAAGSRQGPAIFDALYDLILVLYQAVRGFPKSQQFVLGRRIEETAVQMLAGVIEANTISDKRAPLRAVSVELEKLRVFLRLAKDLGFVSFKKYETLSERVDAIGRMLGGWMKWAQGRARSHGRGFPDEAAL